MSVGSIATNDKGRTGVAPTTEAQAILVGGQRHCQEAVKQEFVSRELLLPIRMADPSSTQQSIQRVFH